MKHLTKILDKVANDLETRGLRKLAAQLDLVSNELEQNHLVVAPDSHVHADLKPDIDWITEQVDLALNKKPSQHVKNEKPGGIPGSLIFTLSGAPHKVKNGIYGPASGDAPVTEDQVTYQRRGTREYESRIIKDKPMRDTDIVTVIVGPDGGEKHVLYTVFGGPEAPQEPNDPRVRNKAESEKFWSEHALTVDSQ